MIVSHIDTLYTNSRLCLVGRLYKIFPILFHLRLDILTNIDDNKSMRISVHSVPPVCAGIGTHSSGHSRPISKGSIMTTKISDQIKSSIIILRDALLARRASLRTITYSDLSGIESANIAVAEAIANLQAFGTGDRCGWGGKSAHGPDWADALILKFGTVAERRALRADQKATNAALVDSIPTA